jgi:tetratricopeptide (TPR) repeat protein
LLDEHERQVLCRLSVFEGGFQREAAERVAGLSLSELAGLMDKSLVLRVERGRYSLHDLVHKYSFVKLKENPEEMLATLERHCRYYGDLLQPFVYRLKGRTQAELQDLIASEIDNFRQAWDWAVRNKRAREIQLLSQGFTWFYELRGWYQEGLAVFKQAVATLSPLERAPESMESADRLSLAAVLIGYGWFLNRHGRNPPAKEHFLRGLSLLSTGESPESLANVIRFIGMLDLQVGEYAEARSYLQESLRISKLVGYTYGLTLCYSHLGMVDYAEGKFQQARNDLEYALELWEELQEPIGTSYCLRHLREVVLKLDASSTAYLNAIDKIQETLELSRTSDDNWGTGTTLNHMGVLASLAGDFQAATAHFREAAGFFHRLGDPYSLAQSYTYLGASLSHLSSEAEARHAYIEGFASAREADSLPFMLEALVGLAWLNLPEADPDLLRTLADLVKDHPAAMFATRQSAIELCQLLPGARADGMLENTSLSLEAIAQRLAQASGSR